MVRIQMSAHDAVIGDSSNTSKISKALRVLALVINEPTTSLLTRVAGIVVINEALGVLLREHAA